MVGTGTIIYHTSCMLTVFLLKSLYVRALSFCSTVVILGLGSLSMKLCLVLQLLMYLTLMITSQNWSVDFPMPGKQQLSVFRLLKDVKDCIRPSCEKVELSPW